MNPSTVIGNSEEMGAVVSIVGDFLEAETPPQIVDQILIKVTSFFKIHNFDSQIKKLWRTIMNFNLLLWIIGCLFIEIWLPSQVVSVIR